ncbi:hypothetical protein VCH24_61020 [Variovorax boronicumulans]|nr:hypothetical protein VCH24_61020 [Variovorax boronicumulans]
MELYAGIDLHSNNSVVTVLDEQDRTVYAGAGSPMGEAKNIVQPARLAARIGRGGAQRVFWGCGRSQGLTPRDVHALIPMGDWCATAQPTSRTKCALNEETGNTVWQDMRDSRRYLRVPLDGDG